MIFVSEIIPKKLSGLTSFLVNTDRFMPELKAIFETLTVSRYYPTEHNWEISCVDLRLFLDQATKIDDIQLTLLDTPINEPIIPASNEEILNLNFKPFKHQIDAFNYTIEKKKWLLLDSMGLGKSLSIIGSAEILKARGLIDHCFIICGVNAVKENWAAEIAKYGNSDYMILGKKLGKRGGISYATIDERAEILKNPIKEFYILTNIETLRSEKIIKAIKKSKNNFGMIAVDEIHRCASKTSTQGSNLLKLEAEYMIGATGTLITNKPESAYLPLVWTKNDHSILTTFRPQYNVYGGVNNSQVIGYKNLDVLQEEIQACSLRRTLDQVRNDMPEKIVSYDIIEMTPEHADFYNSIKRGIKEEADKIELNSTNLLALMTRLRQAIVCPQILTSKDIKSTKLERCAELAEEILSNGEKVVILSNFVEPVKQLALRLFEYNPLICLGEMDDTDVANNNKLFQEDSNYNLIIGTHARIGTGLTFNAAMYMIMLDTPWTYAAFSQSCDRIYRVNNTRPAYIKVLNCKDTVDERIAEILTKKRDLSNYLVDSTTSDTTITTFDETDELKKEMLKIIQEAN